MIYPCLFILFMAFVLTVYYSWLQFCTSSYFSLYSVFRPQFKTHWYSTEPIHRTIYSTLSIAVLNTFFPLIIIGTFRNQFVFKVFENRITPVSITLVFYYNTSKSLWIVLYIIRYFNLIATNDYLFIYLTYNMGVSPISYSINITITILW